MLENRNIRRQNTSNPCARSERMKKTNDPVAANEHLGAMRSLRFLVADDNEADVHWLKMVLDETGH